MYFIPIKKKRIDFEERDVRRSSYNFFLTIVPSLTSDYYFYTIAVEIPRFSNEERREKKKRRLCEFSSPWTTGMKGAVIRLSRNSRNTSRVKAQPAVNYCREQTSMNTRHLRFSWHVSLHLFRHWPPSLPSPWFLSSRKYRGIGNRNRRRRDSLLQLAEFNYVKLMTKGKREM